MRCKYIVGTVSTNHDTSTNMKIFYNLMACEEIKIQRALAFKSINKETNKERSYKMHKKMKYRIQNFLSGVKIWKLHPISAESFLSFQGPHTMGTWEQGYAILWKSGKWITTLLTTIMY